MKVYFTLVLLALFSSSGLLALEPRVRLESLGDNISEVSTAKSARKKRKGVTDKARTVPVIYYSVISKTSGNGIGISMGGKNNGAVAIEWTAQLAHDQQWQLKPVEGPWFQLIGRHSGKALTVRDTDRDRIIQGEPDEREGTHWKLISDSDGFFRLENRENKLFMGVLRNKGAHGDGLVLSEKADTDRQKWKLEVAEIDLVKVLPFRKLALPASEIIGKEHPSNVAELRGFLHETTWSIRYGSASGEEEYQMTFDKAGTLTLNTGRVSKLEILGPKTIKLWAYDTAALSDAFNYFQAVDANGKVYYGVLLPVNQ